MTDYITKPKAVVVEQKQEPIVVDVSDDVDIPEPFGDEFDEDSIPF